MLLSILRSLYFKATVDFMLSSVQARHILICQHSEEPQNKYSCKIKIIIIIMSRRLHGSPRLSLATLLYRLLLVVGLQGYILYRHRAFVYRF